MDLQFLILTHLPPAFSFLLSANMTLASIVHYSFLLFKYVEPNKFYSEVNSMKRGGFVNLRISSLFADGFDAYSFLACTHHLSALPSEKNSNQADTAPGEYSDKNTPACSKKRIL